MKLGKKNDISHHELFQASKEGLYIMERENPHPKSKTRTFLEVKLLNNFLKQILRRLT